jgi:SecD/SecF fusion protein
VEAGRWRHARHSVGVGGEVLFAAGVDTDRVAGAQLDALRFGGGEEFVTADGLVDGDVVGAAQAGFVVKGTDSVGATVGAHIQQTAIVAAIIAMFAILVYVAFRYEFSFAVGSVVALLHDVLITLGIYFLWGGRLTAPMVAAVLTIIGYSINDKIVIMDRIRENLKLGARGSFRELIDSALNQTLGRTIITGGASILATLALFIFGGSVINDFAFTFLVGILSGTYSSIFIAAPFVLWWHKGQRPNIGGGQLNVPTAAAAPVAMAKP